MSTHTVQAEFDIKFIPIGCTEFERAYPKALLEFSYTPGYPARGPSYASGGEPAGDAELNLISATLIDGDGLNPTDAQLQEWAIDWLDDEYGYEKACRVAEDGQGPDPDAAYDAMRDERED